VRLSDGDREVLLERLKRHSAAGRLDIEELERRVAAIITAQTHEEAGEVMADLPPLPGDALSPGRPRRGHGHGDAAAPAVDWRPTSERFRDPRTNRVMRVWEDPAGGRHYVAEDQN
jgi:hypothetical protein